jgi:hypothetical protein
MGTLPWKGERTNGRDQSLAWPRKNVRDVDGNDIATDEIPSEVIFAQHRLARAEFQNPGALDAEFNVGSGIKREKIGELEVEYGRAAVNADDLKTTVAMALDAVQGLLIGSDITKGGTKWVNRA